MNARKPPLSDYMLWLGSTPLTFYEVNLMDQDNGTDTYSIHFELQFIHIHLDQDNGTDT